MADYLHYSYSLTGLIMTAFYLPQIWVAFKTATKLTEISLLSWGTWAVCCFNSFLYAQIVLQDLKVAFFSAANAFCCGLVFLIVLYKRQKYKKNEPL